MTTYKKHTTPLTQEEQAKANKLNNKFIELDELEENGLEEEDSEQEDIDSFIDDLDFMEMLYVAKEYNKTVASPLQIHTLNTDIYKLKDEISNKFGSLVEIAQYYNRALKQLEASDEKIKTGQQNIDDTQVEQDIDDTQLTAGTQLTKSQLKEWKDLWDKAKNNPSTPINELYPMPLNLDIKLDIKPYTEEEIIDKVSYKFEDKIEGVIPSETGVFLIFEDDWGRVEFIYYDVILNKGERTLYECLLLNCTKHKSIPDPEHRELNYSQKQFLAKVLAKDVSLYLIVKLFRLKRVYKLPENTIQKNCKKYAEKFVNQLYSLYNSRLLFKAIGMTTLEIQDMIDRGIDWGQMLM